MPVVTIGDNTTDDFAGTEETWIDQGNPTTNNGGAAWRLAQSSSFKEHTLIKFSGLSNIPSTSTVSAATLRGWDQSFGGTTWPHDMTVHRLLRDWVEAEATYNVYSTGNSWQTAGAQGAADIGSSLQTVAVDDTPANAYHVLASNSTFAADVEDQINGTFPNYGWLLNTAGQTWSYEEMIFEDSTAGPNGERPYLEVDYAAAGGASVLLGRRVYVMP